MTNIQEIAKAYLETLKKNPEKQIDLQNALVGFLKKNNLEKQAPAVVNAVRKQLKQDNKSMRFELHTSRTPSEELLEKIASKFSVKKEDIHIVVDPELIAGIKIYYKGIVMDGSIKNQLSAK